jgi:DNA-binding MarR family transcriptional regulator
VILSGKDLDDARRLMRLLAQEPDSSGVGLDSADRPRIAREALIGVARVELEMRSARLQLLPEGMFGEPAWEILLLLYIEQQGTRLNISGLSTILQLPPTSVLRWLNYLEERQFVLREDHPTDQRSVFIKLTPLATEALDRYLSKWIAKRS